MYRKMSNICTDYSMNLNVERIFSAMLSYFGTSSFDGKTAEIEKLKFGLGFIK